MREALLAVLLAGLFAVSAGASALQMPPGGGMPPGMPGTPMYMDADLVSYEQRAVISPTSASGEFRAVLYPGIPGLSGSAQLTYDAAAKVLEAALSLDGEAPGVEGVVLQALLEATASGSLVVNSQAETVTDSKIGTFTLYLEAEDGENYTLVDLSLEYAVLSEAVMGEYSRETLTLQGPVTIILQLPSYGLDLNVTFDFTLDVTVETNMTTMASEVYGAAVVDFNTGDPMQDAGYAFTLAMMLQQIIAQLGLEDNVTVTTDAAQGSVTVEFYFFVEPGAFEPPMMPGMPPANVTGMFNASMFPGLAGVLVDMDVSYEASLTLQASAGSTQATFALDAMLRADGVPAEAVGFTFVNFTATLYTVPETNETVVEGFVEVDGLPDPTAAFYPALKAAIDASYEAEEFTAIFEGRDGVMYGFDAPEYEVVVFTEANASLLEDLRLFYNGTSYAVKDNGTVVEVAGSGSAKVTLPPGARAVEAVGLSEVEVALAPSPSAVVTVPELELYITNVMGEVEVGLENAMVTGSLRVATLDPAEASTLLPADLNARVAGPAVVVEGVVEGGGYVKVPLTFTPENPALVKISDDGQVEIITDVVVMDGYMEADVSSFSTLIPVDLGAQQQPPGETTTTETTETGTETTTTTPYEYTDTETETETEYPTMTTTMPHEEETETEEHMETTTPYHTETETEEEYTETGTATTPGTEFPTETETETGTEATTTPPAGEAAATETEEEGGISGALAAAAVLVVALAAAVAFLLRRG